jgi:hypothetical protein
MELADQQDVDEVVIRNNVDNFGEEEKYYIENHHKPIILREQFDKAQKEYDKESPYLLKAVGQTPPEDVGGIGGFLNFYEIMQDPEHPKYGGMKE